MTRDAVTGLLHGIASFLTEALHPVVDAFAKHADAWSALFTLGLLIVAILTARYGLRSLQTATEALKLEALPYLVLSVAKPPYAPNPKRYVLAPPEKGLTPHLRSLNYALDEPRRCATGATLSHHYGGRPQWPTAVLEVKNVGRSPAVGIRVVANFDFEPLRNCNYEKASANPNAGLREYGPWEAGRDFPLPPGLGGFGWLTFDSIMPGESAFVSIENRYASKAILKFAATNASIASTTSKRIAVSVLAPELIEIN